MKIRASLAILTLAVASTVTFGSDLETSQASPTNAPCAPGYTAVDAGAVCQLIILTSTNFWNAPVGVTKVDVAVVGGGGSSHKGKVFVPADFPYVDDPGAGGGGGEVKICKDVSVTRGTNVSVAIGAGGTVPSAGTIGTNGQSSSFSSCSALGGLGGDSGNGGASGGGNAGGLRQIDGTAMYAAGGGGGAGSAGDDATLVGGVVTAGKGGNGLVLSSLGGQAGLFSSDSSVYGGGGGGGGKQVSGFTKTFGLGGSGGGGNSCSGTNQLFGNPGAANTGGGGGGHCSPTFSGAAGGSGLVKVRYDATLPFSVAPGVPLQPSATALDGKVRITPVVNQSGGLPNSYTVTASPGGANCTVTLQDTFCEVTGLTNGVEYEFITTASNPTGTSSASVARTATPVTVPGKPGIPTVVPSNNSAIVTPTPPSVGVGGAPTSYLVTASPGGRTCTVTLPSTSCSVTGLINGTPYTFTTVARNGSGNSVSSDLSSSVTPIALPGVPGVPQVIAGVGSATITPVAPPTGGSPATYLVTASPGAATCTVTLPATSCVVTGLTPGVPYTFTAVASNPAGPSAASQSSASVTPLAPASPPSQSNSGTQVSSEYFVVEGFKKSKARLTNSMKKFIEQELSARNGESRIVCTGTVRGKTWTAKREALALSRATAGCDYVRTLLPSVETELKKRLMSTNKQNSLTVRIRVFY